MRTVRSLVVLMAIYFVNCHLFPLAVMASPVSHDSESCSYYFFPYMACILAKVDDIASDARTSCEVESNIVVTLSVKRVLRGDFKSGEIIRVCISSEDADYLCSGRARAESVGHDCLLAFNYFAERRARDSLVSISNIYCPLRGQTMTTSAIDALEQKLEQSPYKFRCCLAVTVLKVEDREVRPAFTKGQPSMRIVFVRVDDILLNDCAENGSRAKNNQDLVWETGASSCFKVGDVIGCYLGENPSDDIYPNSTQSKLVGSRCIWSFNSQVTKLPPDESIFCIVDVSAPFPNQVYTSAEVEQLRAKLASNSALVSALAQCAQGYVRQCCSIDELRKFCQPENRWSAVFRRFPLTSNNRVVTSKLFASDNQYAKVGAAFDSASWFVNVVNGVPTQYEILVDEGGANRWILHMPISLRADTTDLITRERLFQTLQYSISNFKSRHFYDGLAAELENIALVSPGAVVRDSCQRVCEYRCCLTNGQTLVARLDKNQKICDVSIAGRPSAIMRKALKTTVQNWDWCYRQSRVDR